MEEQAHTVEMPDFIRRAIEAQGKYDPDAIEKAAQEVNLQEPEPVEQLALAPDPVPEIPEVEQPAIPGVGTPGTRGGTVSSLEQAMALHSLYRAQESAFVQRVICTLALEHGEYHSEMLVGIPLEQPNVIGTATQALLRRGLIEQGNRQGVQERRISSNTSRRKSEVYRLTDHGRTMARLWSSPS